MKDFRNVKVWEKAHELALLVYQLTFNFPREETFGLRSSIRRVGVEIPAKIAEGCGKAHDNEFAWLMQAAFSLACQLEYYFLLARDLKMLPENEYERLNDKLIEVKKMLTSFTQRLRADG